MVWKIFPLTFIDWRAGAVCVGGRINAIKAEKRVI